jgi:hypothetical protein
MAPDNTATPCAFPEVCSNKCCLQNVLIERSGLTIMNTDRIVLALTGLIILASLALATHVHPYWFGLTAFMGANLVQASITGFCPIASLLSMLGVRPGAAFQ